MYNLKPYKQVKLLIKKNYILAIATCLVMVYIGIRAFTVDFTHDEAYSFHNVKHFWYAEAFCTGNTHWLNSLAMKAAILLGLEHNWQLRWFSVLSGWVFCIVSFLWIQSLEKDYHKLFAFSLLFGNQYVIDYLGVARGYAPGLMLESLSLFLFIINIKTLNRLTGFLALLCSGLSAISNYSFVYFFMAFAIVYFYTYYIKTKRPVFKDKGFYIDVLTCFAISAFIIRAWIFMRKCSYDDVLLAGTRSINLVSSSFLEGILYHQPLEPGNIVSTILSVCLITAIIIICAYGIFRYKIHRKEVFFYCSVLLTIILSGLFVNFKCFKIVLPFARSALFMYPLICICIIYFITTISFPLKKPVIILFSVLLLANFVRTANFNCILDFTEVENTKSVFDYTDRAGVSNIAISHEIYGVYRNYYQMTDNLKYHFEGEPLEKSNKGIRSFGYLLLSPLYTLKPYNHDSIKLDTIKQFPVNNIVLLKVNHIK